jgi:hypothetical protein
LTWEGIVDKVIVVYAVQRRIRKLYAINIVLGYCIPENKIAVRKVELDAIIIIFGNVIFS